jgi:N-acetylglutamate synthase-like GNAT family acetyltransferase
MHIAYLKDYQEWIPRIAKWFHDEWRGIQPKTLQDIQARISERVNTKTLPMALVAVEDNKVIGTVSLIKNESKKLPKYTPIVTSLFVRKKYRNKEVGAMLLKAITNKAKRLGVGRVYVYLINKNHVAFYKKLGWRSIKKNVKYKKGQVLMPLYVLMKS